MMKKDKVQKEGKILIVDDSMFARRLMKQTLNSVFSGQVLEAENGLQAISLFQQQHPDLTLLDITMPGMDGLEVLERLLKEDDTACVIMCSAVGQETMISNAIRIGAQDFIVKPFKPGDIEKAVHLVFGPDPESC